MIDGYSEARRRAAEAAARRAEASDSDDYDYSSSGGGRRGFGHGRHGSRHHGGDRGSGSGGQPSSAGDPIPPSTPLSGTRTPRTPVALSASVGPRPHTEEDWLEIVEHREKGDLEQQMVWIEKEFERIPLEEAAPFYSRVVSLAHTQERAADKARRRYLSSKRALYVKDYTIRSSRQLPVELRAVQPRVPRAPRPKAPPKRALDVEYVVSSH